MKKTFSPQGLAKCSARVPTLNDGHDQATAKQLLKLFTDAQTGMRRIVALGLYAWEIKECKLKHGEWGSWLAAHCPRLTREDTAGKPKASASLSSYMELTKNVLESVGFTVEKYLKHVSNSQTLGICHGGKYLLLPDKKLSEDARELKEKLCSVVDGKTQRQLFLEFKQAEDDGNGNPTPKRGRLKGQGGATVEQREAAQQAEEKARLEALELKATEATEWLLEVSDDKHLGLMPSEIREKLLIALETAVGYLRTLSPANNEV